LAGVLLNGAALAETTKTSNYAEHPEAGAVIEALGERGFDTDRVRRLLADAK
ncbi:MAG TPA: lytic murein transglycosylase B, partial [Alcanivorax sp.]|nr:lytic murein transglycosylase B [Alcanivorax sp.]